MSIPEVDSTDSVSSGSDNLITFRLKTLDYIPLVSIVSGVARWVFGATQIVGGTIQSTIDLVHVLRTGKLDGDDGSYMYNQGKSNMVRGSVAIWPIVGNIALYVYDNSRFANSGDRIDWRWVVQ